MSEEIQLTPEQKKIADEVQQGINALRDKQKALEDANIANETEKTELKEIIGTIATKLDEIEVEQKKLRERATASGGEKEVSEEHKALLHWFRTGEPSEHLRKDDIKVESKVMTISDATTGAYLSSPEMSADMLKLITEFSPIREIATVRTTSKASYRVRKRTAIPTGGRTGETETRTATTGLTFGMEEIPTHEYYAFDDISRWNLEDSDFNMEAELNSAFGEAIGVLEGYDFVLGSGVKRPEGFMFNADVGSVNSGDADEITADGLFKLYFEPKSAYTPRSVFVMNRKTMLKASTLKDSQNNYLLRRLGESPAWNILGARVVEAKDMPDEGADAYPVAFGDFKRAYIVIDRTAIVNLRDPFTQAASGAIRFWTFKRTGGQVVLAEAIKKLKCAA